MNTNGEIILKSLCKSKKKNRIKYIKYLLESGVSPKNNNLLKIAMPGFKIYNRNRNIRPFTKDKSKIFEYDINLIINSLNVCILLIKYGVDIHYDNKIFKNHIHQNTNKSIKLNSLTTNYNFHPLINIIYGLIEFVNTDSVRNKLVKIFDLMLEKGVDININVPIIIRSNYKDFIMGTPIDLACIYCNVKLVEFLISKGAIPTKQTLKIASKNPDKKIFDVLINNYYYQKNNIDTHLFNYFIKM